MTEQGSRVLGRILPAAVQLWVRSQTEHIEQLEVQLQGRDRQVLRGCIPEVSVSAQQAIYRGIHLDRATLSATDIRINLGQVLRGKPLRLLQAFPVRGEVTISQDSLNTSLLAPYLLEGVERFWQSLLARPGVVAEVEQHYGSAALQGSAATQAQLGAGHLTLARGPKQLQAALTMVEGHWLCLEQPTWLTPQGHRPSTALQGFRWDLGTETHIHTLAIQPGQLVCVGQVEIQP